MNQNFFSHITPSSSEDSFQFQAAQSALDGNFKDAIHFMIKSLNLDVAVLPAWAQPTTSILDSGYGQQKEVGNDFLYNRMISENFGKIASCILQGDYGVAAYLMFEYERGLRIEAMSKDLPEDLSELLEYMQNKLAPALAHNDELPSWM